MSLQEVQAQVRDGDRANQPFTVTYDIPDTVQEAVDRWGEEIVYSRFKSSLVIDLQSFMRTQIKKDNASPEAVQEAVNGWTPGAKKTGKPFSEKVSEYLQNMSPEERAAFLAEMA